MIPGFVELLTRKTFCFHDFSGPIKFDCALLYAQPGLQRILFRFEKNKKISEILFQSCKFSRNFFRCKFEVFQLNSWKFWPNFREKSFLVSSRNSSVITFLTPSIVFVCFRFKFIHLEMCLNWISMNWGKRLWKLKLMTKYLMNAEVNLCRIHSYFDYMVTQQISWNPFRIALSFDWKQIQQRFRFLCVIELKTMQI